MQDQHFDSTKRAMSSLLEHNRGVKTCLEKEHFSTDKSRGQACLDYAETQKTSDDAIQSLEIITRMINRTKNEVLRKDFNEFLFYGYAVILTAILTYTCIHFTGNPRFWMLWFIMFLPYAVTLIQTFSGKRKKPEVVTYLQEMMDKVWKIIASMFGLTMLSLLGWSFFFGHFDSSLMIPLTIVYAGTGTSITGMLLKEDWLTYPPLIGLVIATYMFLDGQYDNSWNLLIGAAFLLFMVIPAHICRLNKKQS